MRKRGTALLALALVAAALLTAGGATAAGTTGTAISITVTTDNKPVGDLVYLNHGTKAKISGSVSDGQAGTEVQLQESVFPFSSGFKTRRETHTRAGGAYSFTAKPTLATQYRVVRVSDALQSSAATVYVVIWVGAYGTQCAPGPSCHLLLKIHGTYPAAVAKFEGAKRFYGYFGVRYGTPGTTTVPPPARLRLVHTGRQSRNGSRFTMAFSVTFSTSGHSYNYDWGMCVKDTEARDGFGLPGRHHCGARSISSRQFDHGYVG